MDAEYIYLAGGNFAASGCLLAIKRRTGRLVLLEALIDETEDDDF